MSQIEQLLREVEQSAPANEPRRRRSQIDELLTEVAAEQGYTAADAARDVGVTALRAALMVPQTVIGLADIPTGGRVGRFLEDRLGIRPQEAARIAAGWASDELQLARQRVEDAEGFVETLGAAARDPAVVAAAVAESLPSVVLGGLIGRGITKVAPKVNRWVAGAAGEGAVAAGATASEIRDQTEDGLLTPGQAAAAVGAGAGTALVGGLGGRLAQRAGLPDVDTWAAGGGLARGPGSAARMVGAAAATEGAEELVQSGQEQAWQNLALDRPLLHNVGDAAAMGLVTGVPMGAGVGGIAALTTPATQPGAPDLAPAEPAVEPPPQPPAAAGAPSLAAIDAELDRIAARRAELAPGGPWGPAFDGERAELDALNQQLTQLRADLSAGAAPADAGPAEIPGPEAAPAAPLAPDAGADAPAAPVVEPQQPARAADFWSWARAQYGLVPAQITVGSPVHAALKAEYDALRQPAEAAAAPGSPARSQIDELLAQVDAQQAAPPAAPDADLGAAPADRAALQPRDRSRAASVVQMAEIARAPDYLRLGPSRTPEAGAPMAFAVGDDTRQIRPEQLGREDVAVMSDGQRVPFRYAVVEAPSVQPSHFADGRANPAFDAQVPGQIKALNNARTAGVRAAFELGTAEPYVAGLKADAALHGVSAETIARMRQPMLVRLYSERDNTRDIGARSQGQTLAMSPAELARQDAPLLDSTVLETWQPGDVASAANRDFVRAFVGRLRAAGQDTAALMQADGQLSQDGRRRIQAALMQAAYADSALVEEMFDSTDTDIKAAGEALRNVAGAWANLRDSARAGAINPATDVSDNLMQALHLIQRARRERRGLADLVNQPDLLTGAPPDAVTQGMLRLFYDGQYLTRPVGRARLERSLQDYVAAAAATRAGADMFGRAPAGPIEILAAITGAQHEPAAQVGAQDRTREPDGRGDPGHDPGAQRAAGGQQQLGAGRAAVAATGLGQQRADADTAAGARVAPGHRAGDGGAGPAPGLADAGRAAAPADARAADARGVRAGAVQDAPAAQLTAPDVAREPDARQDQPYETDLFGQPLPRVFHARRGDRAVRPDGAGLRGNVHPAAAVPGQAQGRQADTPAAPGDYFVRTVVGRSAERQLGTDRILTPADAAQATAYLYRSAVERFDGIVTDDAGQPLAVIGGFKGGAAQTPVNIPTLLAEAVRVPGAARVWFSHNHPTGRAQLSAADMRVEALLSQAFRGSGIEPMGLLAVAGKRFAHTAGADSSEGDVPAAGAGATVPVIERELRPNDTAVREITNSGDAVDVAQIFYRRARVPGVILLNHARAISAWVPLPPQAAGELRATGGLNAIYRAVSEANASAAVIVHGGELAHEVKGGVSAAQNAGAALDFAGVRVLDVITVGPDGQTQADSERGIDFKRGPVFSRRPAQQDRDLVIAHSLSAENLLHAAKMGGIPAPSLAVTRKGESITNFGEITLIGDPAMADPRGGAQVFGADIYSPRYPRVERELDRRAVDALARKLAPMAKRMGLRLEVPHSELQTDGQRTLEREPVVMGTFLAERGIEPQVVPETGFTPEQRAALEASALAPYLSRTDAHGLTEDTGFAQAALAQYRATLEGRDALVSALDRDEGFQGNVVRDMARKVARDAQLRERPQADEYETRRALERQIEQAGLANEFQQYVIDQLEAVTKSERVFDGYTAAGRRRYLPHTLDNVVRLLKRDLRGGEGAIAGAGAIRARVTPRFRSVEQIRRSRDRLIPAEQFEAVRDEINTEFLEVARAFSPDMPSNTAAAILESAATRGVRAAAREMGHEISDAAAERASQFLAKLRNLPTAYFEAKIPRVVGLGEFRAAVVPEGVTPRALEALRAAGVDDIRTYPKGDTAARRAAVEVTARDAGAVFARRAAQRGMPTAEAGRIVEAIRALWANAPEVEVVASMQDAAVPEAVRQHDAQQRSAGAAGEPEGFFHRGKVYIVAGALNRPADVVRVLFHEALGHYGLRGVFGGRLDAILDQIAHVRAPEMRAKAKQYGLPITPQEARSEVASLRREAGKSELAGAALDQAARALLTTSRRQVAEEVLAEMAQTRPELGFVKRAIAAIRTWLREHVPGFEGLALSDAEIVRSFILPARNWVERGAGDAEAGPTHFSRAPQGAPQTPADDLAALDDLFALPRSDKTDLAGIVADLAPTATVTQRATVGGQTHFDIRFDDDTTARVTQRAPNPFGPSVYGFDLDDGEMINVTTDRPGDNPDDVDPGAEDVWIDVSLFQPGLGKGEIVYAAVANYAHNTGRIFIGDPAGLSDEAMHRRLEHMLSSALKFGTTRHLAPHPRQTRGAAGVPALRWVYGDDDGNIERMIDVSAAALKNAGIDLSRIAYDNGSFIDVATGRALQRGPDVLEVALQGELGGGGRQRPGGDARLRAGVPRAGQAGWRTAARTALLVHLKAAVGAGRQRRGRVLDGLRGQLPDLKRDQATGRDWAPQERIFYSRRKPDAVAPPDTRTAAERAQAIIETPAATSKPIDRVMRAVSRGVGLEATTSWVYDRIGDLLQRWTPERIKAGVVADYGVPEAVIDRRTLLDAAKRVQMRRVGVFLDRLGSLSRDESRVVYEWMNLPDGAERAAYNDKLRGLPEGSVRVLREVQQMIDDLSREAVRLGQLSPEAYQRHRFAYVRRSYLKHVVGADPEHQAMRRRAITVLGDQYRGRGLEIDAGMAQMRATAPEWWGRKLRAGRADAALKNERFIRLERRAPSGEGVAALPGVEGQKPPGRVVEVAYWPAGQPLPPRYGDWDQTGVFEVRDVRGDRVVLWRDWTKQEREQMGEIDEARFAIARTLQGMIHDVEIGRYFEWMARTQALKPGEEIKTGSLVDASERWRDTFKTDEWVRVPQTKVTGTDVLKYGALAGRIIPGPVWNDIRHVVNTEYAPFGEVYAKVLLAWKISKALALDTPIPTPGGWTTMGDIKVGDRVFDEQGKVCEVIGATDVQLDRKCFDVAFSDGTKITADAEHLWFTVMRGLPGVRTTEQIRATLKERTRGDNNHKIPVAGALDLPEAALPIPPYALGVWLGDGATRSARVSAGGDDAAELMEHLAKAGIRCGKARKDPRNNVLTFHLRRPADRCLRGHDASEIGPKGCRLCANAVRRGVATEISNPTIQVRMRDEGLLGNKHIQAAYLRASEAQRRELLMGLMDTDGNITEKGLCSFTTTLPALRDGFVELARSLGYKPTVNEWQPTCNGKPGKPAWRIHFKAYADRPVFKIERKRARLAPPRPTRQRSQTRQIVSITPVPSVPVRCIAVSSESRLYLAGEGMVPTHNTALSPAVHMNNVMSSFVMADWHDVSAGHIYKALRILLGASQRDGQGLIGGVGNVLARAGMPDREAARVILDRYQDAGGDVGTWVTNEIAQDQLAPLLDVLERELATKGNASGAAQVGVLAALQHALHLRWPQAWESAKLSRPVTAVVTEGKNMIDLYQREDDVFRLAAWLREKETGADDVAAGKVARRSFLDYRINAPWIQAMRATAWPFISYTYRATPMLLETMGKKPHKLIKLMMFAGGLSALGSMIAGESAEDEERTRALLPDRLAGGLWGIVPKMIRMPWNDEHGSPVFLDVRRWVPVSDVVDVAAPNTALPWFPPLVPGGPLVIFGEIVANRSMFTGRPITLETDTGAQKAAKVADHLYKALMPNLVILPNTHAWDGVVGSLRGRTDAFGREASTAQALARSVGVRLGSYPQDVLEQNLRARTRIAEVEIERNIRQLQRQLDTGRISHEQFERDLHVEQQKLERLRERMYERLQ